MEDILKRILDIESEQRALTEEAERALAHSKETISARTRELYDSYMENAKKKLIKIEADERKSAEEAAAAKKRQYDRAIADLELKYNNNRKNWVSCVVSRVLDANI